MAIVYSSVASVALCCALASIFKSCGQRASISAYVALTSAVRSSSCSRSSGVVHSFGAAYAAPLSPSHSSRANSDLI